MDLEEALSKDEVSVRKFWRKLSYAQLEVMSAKDLAKCKIHVLGDRLTVHLRERVVYDRKSEEQSLLSCMKSVVQPSHSYRTTHYGTRMGEVRSAEEIGAIELLDNAYSSEVKYGGLRLAG